MSGCNLDFNKEDLDQAMQIFCHAVSVHKSLRELDISKNSFSDKVSAELALMITSPTLMDLNLSFTRIGDKTMTAIA